MSERPRPRQWLLALAATIFGLAAGLAEAPDASAHASLLETTPAPGARVESAPRVVSMLYTEPLNARLTRVEIVDSTTGRPVASRLRVERGRKLVVAPDRRLADGAYRLRYRSVSTIDGHIREGSIAFGVRAAALGPAVEVRTDPLGGSGPARIALRGILYAALTFFAGGLLAAVLLGPRDGRDRWVLASLTVDAATEARTRRLWLWNARAGAIALAAATASVLVETIEAADGIDAASMADFLLRSLAGISRLGLLLLLALSVWATRRRPRVAAALVALAMLAIAAGGHAAGVDSPVLSTITDWVHLLAGAVWLGGIAHVVAMWLPVLRGGAASDRRAVLTAVLPRFGRVALPAFLIVAMTGSVNAITQLSHVDDLWTTAYGAVLSLKVAIVALIAAMSFVHVYRLRPALLRTDSDAPPPRRAERRHLMLLGTQPAVSAAVVIAAATLVAFPLPPREAAEVVASARPGVPCDPCPLPRPRAGELATADRVGRLTAALWIRRGPSALQATLRVMDRRRRPVRTPVRVRAGHRAGSCGSGCWRFTLPRTTTSVAVSVADGGRKHTTRIPTRWDAAGDRRARRLIAAAQHSMRRLKYFRQRETVASAVRPDVHARIDFRFQAPDRTAFVTGSGLRQIIIGREAWLRPEARLPWQRMPPADTASAIRDGFRWTVFAETARLLGFRRVRGRRVADVALLDWAYPVWYRVTIDVERSVVLRQTLLTPENAIRDVYRDLGVANEITAPGPAGDG